MEDTTLDPTATEATEAAPVPEAPALSEAQILAQSNARFKAGIQDSQPRRDVWRENWRAFENEYDDAGALPWQCDVVLPKVSRMVQALAGDIKDSATRGTTDWYTVTGQTPFGELVEPIVQTLIRANLEHAEFDKTIEPGMVSGLLTCSPAYIALSDNSVWPGYTRPELVDMRCLVRDPSGRDEWIIQTTVMPYAAAKSMGATKKWDLAALEECKASQAARDPSIEAFISAVSHVTTPTTNQEAATKTVSIEEHWGPLYDEQGEYAYEYAYWVVANGTKVLCGPTNDPTGDKTSPYVDGDLLPRVFDPYAKSYVEDGRSIAVLINQTFRRLMDGLAYDVNRAFILRDEWVTPQTLDDMRENGIAPGFIIHQTDGEVPALMPVQTGQFPPEALALFQILLQEWEDATGHTRLSQGLPDAPGTQDKTLGVAQMKANATARGKDALTASYEDNTLAPLVRRMVRHIQLYCDIRDKRVQDICHEQIQAAVQEAAEMIRDEAKAQMAAAVGPDALQQMQMVQQQMGVETGEGPEMPAVERDTPEWEAALDLIQEALQEPMSVRVSGLTGVVEKDKKQSLMGNLVQTAMSLPGGPQLLDTPKILSRAAHLADTDPEDVLIDDADKAWLVQMAQQMAQGLARQMVQSAAQQTTEQMMAQGGGQEMPLDGGPVGAEEPQMGAPMGGYQ